jgi:methionyl aminopeptidase
MIMEENEISAYQKAGEIAVEVKRFVRSFVKPGVKLLEIAEQIEKKIRELGGEPAFPVNLSLNEIAAHYTPDPEDETIAEGILKIDIGISVEGFIADTAISIDLTPDGEFKDLIEANKGVLASATEIVRPGMKVMDVGKAVQKSLKKFNEDNETEFSVIRSLSGHSLAEDTIHAGLTISNYPNENDAELNDMAFAIEPFLTSGDGDIYEGKVGEIYGLVSDAQVRDGDAREILKFIKENYKTRPFCRRWLVDEGFSKVNFALSVLVKQGILHNYPVLVEKSKAPVSQAENTFLIYGDKVEVTTE